MTIGDEKVVRYEYEVWQRDALQAGGSTADYASARFEADHYAMMYGQDGPVEVRIYEKRLLAAQQPAPSASMGVGGLSDVFNLVRACESAVRRLGWRSSDYSLGHEARMLAQDYENGAFQAARETLNAIAQAPVVHVMVTEKPDISFIANALLDFADDLESQGLANGALRHQAKLLEAALGQEKGNGS